MKTRRPRQAEEVLNTSYLTRGKIDTIHGKPDYRSQETASLIR